MASMIEAIIRGFFQARVLQINVQQPFVLSSGKSAPMYLDHRLIFSEPALRRLVVQEWCQALSAAYPELTASAGRGLVVFAGTATAGIAPAYALAEAFSCGFVYVRSKAKEHGLKSSIEGHIPPGASVIVVDDMVTTGGSVLAAAEQIRQAGHAVLACTCISSHHLEGAQRAFRRHSLPLVHLFTTPNLIETACQQGLLDQKDKEPVLQWLAAQANL